MALLDRIATGTTVDVGAKFEEGRKIGEQKLTKDLSGKILAETLGSKIGMQAYQDLQRLNPEVAIKLKSAIQSDSDADTQALVGITMGMTKIIDDGGTPQEAAKWGSSQAMLLQKAGRADIAQKIMLGAKALIDPSTQEQTIRDLRATNSAFGGASSKRDRVKSSEVIDGFIIEDDGNGNFRKTKVSGPSEPSEEVKLKRQELQMKIEDREAAAEARKIAAVEAAAQKDSKAVSSVFEAQNALDNLDALLKDDAYKAIYGVGDAFLPTFFSDSMTLEAQRDQAVNLLGLESREKLKGSGTISDSESAALARSATILGNPGISEAAAEKEIRRVRDVFGRARDRSLKNPEAKRLLRESLQTRDNEGQGRTSFQVKLPSGGVATFGTQAEADAFLVKAGL